MLERYRWLRLGTDAAIFYDYEDNNIRKLCKM